MSGPAAIDGAADYAAWNSPASIAAERDPMRRVAMVMMHMTTEQGKLLKTESDSITLLTDRMGVLNDAMKILNAGIAANAVTKDDAQAVIFQFPSPSPRPVPPDPNSKYEKAKAALIAAGVDMFKYTEDIVSPNDRFVATLKSSASDAVTALRIDVEELSSQTQLANLGLQTLMGRYNGAFDVVTNALKKNESQGSAVTSNFRR